MDFPLHFQILRGRVQGFFLQTRKLILFCQMAFIYQLNSHGGPQSFDFVITTYSYPLFVDLWINGIQDLRILGIWDFWILGLRNMEILGFQG